MGATTVLIKLASNYSTTSFRACHFLNSAVEAASGASTFFGCAFSNISMSQDSVFSITNFAGGPPIPISLTLQYCEICTVGPIPRPVFQCQGQAPFTVTGPSAFLQSDNLAPSCGSSIYLRNNQAAVPVPSHIPRLSDDLASVTTTTRFFACPPASEPRRLFIRPRPGFQVALADFTLSGPAGTHLTVFDPQSSPIDPNNSSSFPSALADEATVTETAVPVVLSASNTNSAHTKCKDSCDPWFLVEIVPHILSRDATALVLQIRFIDARSFCPECSSVTSISSSLPFLNQTIQLLLTIKDQFEREISISGSETGFSGTVNDVPISEPALQCPGIFTHPSQGLSFLCYLTPFAVGWFEFHLDGVEKLHFPVVGQACPVGAVCTSLTLGLQVQSGFWCDIIKYEATGTPGPSCTRCVAGVCCPNGPCSLDTGKVCAYGRAGTLCGECQAGMTASFFSATCAVEDGCNGYRWVVPLLCIVSLGLAVYYVFRNSTKPQEATAVQSILKQLSDGRSVLVQFYQLSGRITAPVQLEVQAVATALLAIFSVDISVSGQQDTSSGVCILAGVSPLKKVALGFLPPLIVFVMWIPAIAIEKWWRVMSNSNSEDNTSSEKRHLKTNHVQALVSILTTLYSTVSTVSLSLVSCVKLPNRSRPVLLVAGSVECFEPWQYSVLVLVAFLFIVPFITYWLMHTPRQHPLVFAVQQSLGGPFKPSRQYWISVLLASRLIMATISTFVLSSVWRSIAQFITALSLLCLQSWARPYRSPRVQGFATVCGAILVWISTDVVSIVSSESTRSPIADDRRGQDILVLALLVIPAGAILLAHLACSPALLGPSVRLVWIKVQARIRSVQRRDSLNLDAPLLPVVEHR